MKKIQLVGILFSILFLTLNFIVSESPQSQIQKLIFIAKNYKNYDNYKVPRIVVTDSSKYKWTQALCVYTGEAFMGYRHERDSTFFSKADTIKSLHGNKLYQLYVKDQESYYNFYKQQPIGQTIVKETWNVEEVDTLNNSTFKMFNKNNNKWFIPTAVSQLFIMYKEEPSDKNDLGCVYGIVDIEKGIENIKVLSNGNLSNCISCHKDTKYDRIFGKFNN